MDSHRVTAPDGTRLQVDETGPVDGAPILFVHDLSHNRLVWRHQFQSPLADEFRLLAMDLRGHGASDEPVPDTDDPPVFADDLNAVVEAFDLADVCVVAWGHGGVCVADYLETYGTDAVVGLDLVGALTEVGTQSYADATPTSVTDCVAGLTSNDVEESIEGLRRLLEISTAESLAPADRHFLLGCGVAVSPAVREAMLSRTVARDGLWEHVEFPVLVTHGTSDEVVMTIAAKQHVAAIPAASPSFYTEVGHMPFWEEPDRFNQELREFVSGLSVTR